MPGLSTRRTALLAALLTLLCSVAFAAPEILWDTWGVPHIFGQSDADLCYGFGWAQAESHGDLVLRLYGEARGRAAEYWGEDQLASDRQVRTLGIPRLGQDWYGAQTPRFRRLLDAFAAGFNAYAAAHPDRIEASVRPVLPVTGADVLAHGLRVMQFGFVGFPEVSRAERWGPPGSNGWAIGPTRSESGHAMLLANPHLPWSGLFLFCEAHFVAPGTNLYGADLVGFPMLAFAFNDHLGWTLTVNTMDGADLYELTLDSGGYRFDGKVRAFEVEQQTIRVKQKDGTFRNEPLTIRRSVHGPVLSEKDGKAVALRVVGLDRPGMPEEWWDLGKATDLAGFERILQRMQVPMFNVLYADGAGHILYLDNGLIPVRAQGDWDYWSGVVPGDTSATLWTAYHSYRDLPRVLDPPTGWLQNCNDSPWSCTYPAVLKPADFPRYLAPQSVTWRARRSLRMRSEPGKLSFEKLVRDKHSTRIELADRVLDDLVAAARAGASEEARQAAEVLAKWDRQAGAESRGAALFTAWEQEMGARGGIRFAREEDPSQPLTTPWGLADLPAAVPALEAAAQKVKQGYGAVDVPWGEAARLCMGAYDLPANGAAGAFRTLHFAPGPNGKLRAVHGDSFVLAVEFTTPLRAEALLSYGNASQPGSPHLGDQLPLFAKQQLRPVWRTRPDIEAHLESRETLPAWK